MSKPIGYEIGEFKDGKWVDFADCTLYLMSRKEAESWLHGCNSGLTPSGTEYRLIEIHEATATEESR